MARSTPILCLAPLLSVALACGADQNPGASGGDDTSTSEDPASGTAEGETDSGETGETGNDTQTSDPNTESETDTTTDTDEPEDCELADNLVEREYLAASHRLPLKSRDSRDW